MVTSTDNDDFPPPREEVQLIAGTAWLFAREAMLDAVDVLVIDEAGQVALADSLAMAQAARSVVLLGDPQQLAHVSQGTHPRGSGASVLEHLLGPRDTVPPQDGILLNRTWRMHPDVCAFVSQAMYDGRLDPVEACAIRHVEAPGELGGTGVRFVAVQHEGNRQTAPEEAQAIAATVDRLLADGRLAGFEAATASASRSTTSSSSRPTTRRCAASARRSRKARGSARSTSRRAKRRPSSCSR